MLSLFKPRLPVDAEEFEWLLAGFAWLMREFGGVERIEVTPLVLPTLAFFPPSKLEGHDRALELFGQVKALCGMADWQCDLLPGAAERERQIVTAHALRHHSSPPLGTFGHDNGRYYITYNPSTLAQPPSLVATFAHELSHYLLHTAETSPPGGRELREHATDLGAVFMGFGTFLANSAKSFRQFQNFGEQGWEMRGQGYLSENALVTALALFVLLSGTDAAAAERDLKDYLRKPFRAALAVIRRGYPHLAASIAAVDLGEWR
ncbi:MAG: hypothetical protein JWN66_1606 [Sphingomonas bacterium]|uniref:hypothetical protein n=1 Tax=Sphingomonas bacterium TaxID=1895847 RepID=UPI00262742E7|nr:hypothetical protein [Sphingomonas bacterium]MDB5704490.1 hypothetical protein [Sphingomonas bacterium]